MRQYKLRHLDVGFPATSVLKTKVQMIYNALKGGLDANTQQYRAICPSIKATFEQKYVVHLLLAIVGNAWRAFQLLGHRDRVTEIPMLSLRKMLANHSVGLRDFNHSLALGLIDSADDIYFQNVLVRDNNRSVAQTNTTDRGVLNLGFERNPSTLSQRLSEENWPIRYRLRTFTKNRNFLELRLTENNEFKHKLMKCSEHGNKKKKKQET